MISRVLVVILVRRYRFILFSSMRLVCARIPPESPERVQVLPFDRKNLPQLKGECRSPTGYQLGKTVNFLVNKDGAGQLRYSGVYERQRFLLLRVW